MVLFITPSFTHRPSHRPNCRLIVQWGTDGLTIGEWDSIQRAHLFMGEGLDKCPIINKVIVGEIGIGCSIEGQTADGKTFQFKSKTADFIEFEDINTIYRVF